MRLTPIAILFVWCTAAFADVSGIYVEYWNGSSWVVAPGHEDHDRNQAEAGYASGSNISITNAGSVIYRVFAVSETTTDIGVITVSGSGTSPDLMVGIQNATPPSLGAFTPLDANGCRNLVAVRQSGSISLDVQLSVEDLTGNNDVSAQNSRVPWSWLCMTMTNDHGREDSPRLSIDNRPASRCSEPRDAQRHRDSASLRSPLSQQPRGPIAPFRVRRKSPHGTSMKIP